MEQTSYWIWNKRKFNGSSPLQASSYNDSWVEQAFAQDSSNPLGGCIWPPRSYSCNFCKREFRSAQALGGHMNVHRRDRARLKQSTTHSDEHHLHQKSPCTILGQYPSHVCTLVYPNPNFPSSSSTVSPPSITSEQILVSSQHLQKGSLCSTLPLLSNFIAFKVLTVKNDSLRAEEMDSCKSDSLETCEDDEASSRKKLKNNGSFLSCIRSSAAIEDLDLELRLGDKPKV